VTDACCVETGATFAGGLSSGGARVNLMPTDISGSAAADASPSSQVGALMASLIEAAAAGQVVYLTGPGDDDVPAAAVVPVAVAEAGLAALAARSDQQP
jgi:hypothetical protein